MDKDYLCGDYGTETQWTQIRVTVKLEQLDALVAVMSMINTNLMIEDYSDIDLKTCYGDLIDESILNADRNAAAVSVFISEMKSPAGSELYIKNRLEQLGVKFEIVHEGIREEDWADSWKQYYKPIKTGDRLVIVPVWEWEDYTPEEGEVIVLMDPGMAFGTGTHETTRLVIRLMQEVSLEGTKVLDIGCGSGILSICASKLGSMSCNAYDIDPVAVKVTRENARDGGCDNIVAGVSDLLLGVERKAGGYDICFANIVADIIIRMLPDIRPYLKAGAPIILSGIINESAEMVRNKVKECGFSIVKEEKENDWVAMIIR